MARFRELKGAEGRRSDVWFCNQALKASRDKACEVYTSILSVAECTAIKSGGGVPDDKVKRFFEMLLLSGKSGLTLVSMTQAIATKARDLRWNLGINLKGADALHVATAIAMKCDELWTNDGKIWKSREKIADFQIRVVRPSSNDVLPHSYRQDDFIESTKS